MGEFSAEWLTLREPADHRARAQGLTTRVIDYLDHLEQARPATNGASSVRQAPLRVLDLGTGSGSNVRFLLERLPSRQEWCVVDRDVDLLREFTKRMSAWGLDRGAMVNGDRRGFAVRTAERRWEFQTCTADLVKLTDPEAAAAIFAPLFEQRALVTASALLDLVSERWLQALVARCAASRAAVLFVLTYDGRLTLTPGDPDDEFVRTLVNRHQRMAKSFGKALGPDATACAERLFTAAGYTVSCEASDWRLSSADAALQRPLLDGWADAAAEIARRETSRVREWQSRRQAALAAGDLQILVGHQDLAAFPADV